MRTHRFHDGVAKALFTDVNDILDFHLRPFFCVSPLVPLQEASSLRSDGDRHESRLNLAEGTLEARVSGVPEGRFR